MDLTTETDRRRLERTLDTDPKDWGLRLLLADVLEEVGEDVAAWGQRWQSRCRVVPLSITPSGPWSWWDGDGWDFAEVAFRLPHLLFTLLVGSPVNGGSYLGWRDYSTRAAAEADLGSSLSLLPDRGASFLPPAVECRQSPERRTWLT